jgi:hypothetical protein
VCHLGKYDGRAIQSPRLSSPERLEKIVNGTFYKRFQNGHWTCLVFPHVQIITLLFAANNYRLCVVRRLTVHGWVAAFSRRLISISVLKMTRC